MDLFDIVMKLTGPVHPVGETRADDERFANLERLLLLMTDLNSEVEAIAAFNKDRHEFSMARAGEACATYLEQLAAE